MTLEKEQKIIQHLVEALEAISKYTILTDIIGTDDNEFSTMGEEPSEEARIAILALKYLDNEK